MDISPERADELKRRRRERYLIGILLIVISVLSYIGTKIFYSGLELPFSSTILVFSLININIILLLLLLYLTVRNLVKLFFERKKRIMGARLRAKLVLAFIILSLLPTIILFFVSVQFISVSLEYWYRIPVERTLRTSAEVCQEYYKNIQEEISSYGNIMSRLITYHGYLLRSKKEELDKFIKEKRMEYRLASIMVFSQKMKLHSQSLDERVDPHLFPSPSKDRLKRCIDTGTDIKEIRPSITGDIIRTIVPIFSRTESKAVVGLLVLSRFVPKTFVNRLKKISKGYEEYKQFKTLKGPIKLSHMITLSIVTLLIIFSSIWFGFFLSKEITVPIQKVAEGTKRVASGDYDFFIDMESEDEIGILVNSFNKMTSDLKNSKRQLEEAYKKVIESNKELENRKIYIETILSNVAAGVISLDKEGRVLTINRSAEMLLSVRATKVIGKRYQEVMADEYIRVIDEFLNDQKQLQRGAMERQISVNIQDRYLTFVVYLNVLRDEKGDYAGLVVVFEDITEIEKAQRMSAWREIARRIAHEVKNPLTPIQLSAQRIKKRYGNKLSGEDGQILKECTDLIITQVEELRRLVNEFAQFSRMPVSRPVPGDVIEVIDESIKLFKEVPKGVEIRFSRDSEIPLIPIDKDQMKRALVNIIDNAIDAIDGAGKIEINLRFDRSSDRVIIEVVDNGRGIPPEYKGRVFEPYFSTKKHGTGLGLTIVNTIIKDHNGDIRIEDNHPHGSRCIIELPLRV